MQGGQSHALMWNGVGGSTNVYAALWPRFRPSDFRKGREHGLAPDWPITYADLAPFYDEADRLVGVSGLAGDPGMPPRPPYPCAPLPMRESGRVMARGFDRLGWHWWPMPVGTISEPYEGRLPCNGCGNCGSGCPRGSMAKMSLTLWPRALAAGVQLRTGARVERIETGPDGRATGAVYIDRATGNRVRQTADMVIVAGNGIGSPRLLLMSASGRHPHGLANGNDVVGRYLLHHTLVAAEIWVDEPIRSYMGNSGALISSEFAETDLGPRLRQRLQLQRHPHRPGRRRRHRRLRAPPGALGRGTPRLLRPPFRPQLRRLRHRRRPAAARQPRHPVGHRDRQRRPARRQAALPAARERSADDALRHRAAARPGARRDAFDVAVTDYFENGVYRTPAWHMLGTCRMGADRETSTVDRWHQAWEVPNLYICDGSSFATGGVVNPTSTVTALALRCARHIAEPRPASRPPHGPRKPQRAPRYISTIRSSAASVALSPCSVTRPVSRT